MDSKNNAADIEQIITAALEDWKKQALSSGAGSKESQKAGSKAMKLLYQNTYTLKEYLPQLVKEPNARQLLEQIIIIGNCWTDEEYATMGGEDDFNIYCSGLASPEVLADLEKTAAQQLEAATGQPLKEKQSAIKDKGCWHNEDFTTVIWYGIEYQFNKRQARCIKYLWENESATEKRIGVILDTGAFTPYRLRDTFRNKKGYHDAWGEMIQNAGKGCFKLTKPKS